MSDRRHLRLATTSVRVVIGTVVAIAFVAGVVTAIAAPWPELQREPVAISSAPEPAAAVISCTGPLLALGRDASAAGGIVAAAPPSLTSGVLDGSDPAAESTLAPAVLVEGAGGAVFTAEPRDRQRTDVAASSSASADADDLRGFAASACRQPLLESWLVGGSTATGSSDIVLLANPGSVPATVQLTVYGVGGAQTPPGGQDLVVAPGTQQLLPLAGIAGGEDSPVVQVSAVGAPVQASLQSSSTRTLIPVGVDHFAAVAAPAERLTIAGLVVPESDADAAAEPRTIVRMLSPAADANATVTVTEVGSGASQGAPLTVALAAGVPLALDLGALAASEYIVSIAADAPVVAATWHATGFAEGDDFAWFTPSPLIDVPSLFAVPAGPVPLLVLANESDAAAVIVLTPVGGGAMQEVAVPAAGSASLPADAGTVYQIDPGAAGGIRAAVSFGSAGAIAGYPVWPSDTAAEAVLVYP